MKVNQYSHASEFLDVTSDHLMKNETANSIIYSYAVNQTKGIESARSTRFYAVVEDDRPLLPAMFTPEVWPLLTEGPDEAARLLARYLFAKHPTITGVTGPKDASLAFADEWEGLSRCDLEIHHNTRLYDCNIVADIKLAEGNGRQATLDDFELVKKWRYAFREDANAPLGTNDSQIADHLKQGRYYFWVTDQPVSMALYVRETGNTGMIGVVYTPPEYRNHGYATAVTTTVTRVILNGGKKYATLYTDLDNPTSNSIYMKIGYRPIMDSTVWKFVPNQ